MEQERELFEKIRSMVKSEVFDDQAVSEWWEFVPKQSDDEKKRIVEQVKGLLGNKTYIDHFLWLSMLNLTPSEKLMKEFFAYINANGELTWDNLFYIAQQLGLLIFKHQEYDTYDLICSNWKLLKKSYQMCKVALNMELQRIPMEDRNEGLGIVIAEQMLIDNHGPTKTALDRALTIKKELGEVLLINTAEMLSPVGSLYWECGARPNYLKELNAYNYYEWRNTKIPFVQCDDNMPNLETMRLLLENIRELRPKIVIAVGGMSLFAGLVNEMIPVLNVSTTQSGISTVLTDFQTALLRKNDTINTDNIHDLLEDSGINSDHIINGRFTFAFKEQFSKVTREDFNITEQDFVLVAVGLRLYEELDENFWNMFRECMTESMKILILGTFGEEDIEDLDEELKQHIIIAGQRNDVLAHLDICDLYINPIRKGGGTSAVEAMYKGIPIVSVDYGDVAGIVGEEFLCDNYEEMKSVIYKYMYDKEYYESQSQLAIQKAKELTDTEGEFLRILEKYINAQKS